MSLGALCWYVPVISNYNMTANKTYVNFVEGMSQACTVVEALGAAQPEKVNANINQALPMPSGEMIHPDKDYGKWRQHYPCIHLDLEHYGALLDAIVTDDVEKLQTLLNQESG